MRFIQVTGIIILSCFCYLSGSHPAMAQTRSKNTKKSGTATSQQTVPTSVPQIGPTEHPTPSSLASLTVIQAPTDEVTLEEGKIYHLRVRPNFVCLVELPVLPEAILVGNPARFLVEPLPETSTQPVKTAPPSSHLLLVKPLKINDPAGDRLVTNLTIKLANGRVVSILLDNTDSETLTVYRCRFVDPTVPASQTQTSSAPQAVEPPVSFPEVQTRLRTFTDTSLQERPASTVTNQFGTASFWVRREGQYLLAVLRITPASQFKKVVLTTPSWTLGETTVQPKFTQHPLPETMKKASVTGSFLFDLSESSEALQFTTTGSSQPVLGVQMGVQTALISLQASPASVVDQTGPVGTDAKAFPMLSSPAGEPHRADSLLTPAQQDQVQRLNQITSGATGSISPVGYRSGEPLPAERQPFSLAQERLDFLTQTIGIRSDQVKRVTVGEVLAGIYAEQFQGMTLAVVCLERFRGSTPREISPLQWDTGGQVVTARAIFKPFPRTLTTVPLISGFIFDATSISPDRFKCGFKVGNDSVKIQAGSELTQGSTDRAEKIVQAGSVEFSVSQLRLENIGPILRVKARNSGTQPIEKIELLVVAAGKASSGTQLAQLTQLDPIHRQIEPVPLRGTGSIDFRIPESIQPDQIEIRWAHQGTWTSVRVSLHSK